MTTTADSKSRRRVVLVVTGTPEDLDVLQDQLGGSGYELEHAWSTEKAKERIEAAPPDLVLLEVRSFGQDGVEFCRGLRARPETEAMPVIAIADDCSHEQEDEILEAGADGLLCRPFEAAELLSRVRTLVRLKDLHDRVAEQNRQLLDVNARLDRINQELMARNRELEEGIAMAHRLQEALLPQEYPHIKNIGFSHTYTPADAIGGDFFQIIGMRDGRAAIFIADVSGHGVRAAIVTSIVKTVIDYIDMNDKTPTQVLSDFNSRFRGVLGPMAPQIYATGVVMMVDGENRSVTIACAGHPIPIHVNKKRKSAEPIMSLDDCGPALGFLTDPEYPTVEKGLGVGDIVLGFTDGIYEVLSPKGEMFGMARLERLIGENTRLIPRELIQKVVRETEEFRGTPRRPDDACLVAFEVN